MSECVERIGGRMKPVILIGAGCSRGMADYLCTLGVPVLTTWQGIDRVPEDAPVFCGRPGVIGQRAANIIQQRAGVVYVFGARLDMEQVNHKFEHFAPHARVVVYDIDRAELEKLPASWFVYQRDLSVQFDVKIDDDPRWLAWCRKLYGRFRYELDGTGTAEDFVDPYYFIRRLGEVCTENETIVPGSSGMQSCAFMQAFKVKRGQRILLCNTIGAMGMEPMAIGAALGTGGRVVVVTGDGGFMLNFQELEVVRRLNLNIKYFVFYNGGYGSITTMQDARFNLRVGGDPQSGLTFPDLARIAAVWGIAYHEINSNLQMDRLAGILNGEHAAIVRVNSSLAFRYACKVQSSLINGVFVNDAMEDMTPKIDDLKKIMKEKYK